MMKFPPRKINPIYGYRTRASMRSDDAWKFAQKLCGRRFILLAIGSALVAIAVWLFELSEPWSAFIMLSSLIGGFVYMFKSVEKRLAKRFPSS